MYVSEADNNKIQVLVFDQNRPFHVRANLFVTRIVRAVDNRAQQGNIWLQIMLCGIQGFVGQSYPNVNATSGIWLHTHIDRLFANMLQVWFLRFFL